MAGCFGNAPEDRWMEQQLNAYLNQGGICICDGCGYSANEDDWDYDEEENVLICPECGWKFKL